MTLNARYPYLTAWIGILALNGLAALVIVYVPSAVLQLLLMAFVGFFIFKFVVNRNLLPYVTQKQIINTEPANIDKPDPQ
jgi:hypothetical protein